MGYLDEFGERIAKACDDAGLEFKIISRDGQYLYQLSGPSGPVGEATDARRSRRHLGSRPAGESIWAK